MSADPQGLKDFQRRTVEHVCGRMLDGDARRFLVADEVGLGKTLVARGVVANTVARLRADGVRRVDIVYICSNQEIAKQNLARLQPPDQEAAVLPSRLTLLPVHLHNFNEDGVNFISFTPGTSFERRSRSGWTQERALLMKLLKPVWHVPGHKGVYNLFRVNARRESLEAELAWLPEPDHTIAARFTARMAGSPLRDEFEELIEIGRRRDFKGEELQRRLNLIGQLRRELARCCVDALEPDLIILDEFQRFAELLDGESEAAELAEQLFSFDNGRGEFARVLLLSATPYKALSKSGEQGSSHHSELVRLLRFLLDDAAAARDIEARFAAMRDELFRPTPDIEVLRQQKNKLETALRRVIARTERLASSENRNGMLVERKDPSIRLEVEDVRQWADLAQLRRALRDRELLTSAVSLAEFWKSAPWLGQFMDSYRFKQAITAALRLAEQDSELAGALGSVRGHLPWERFRDYRTLDPANPRLRSLARDTVDRAWDLLWIPASLPYHGSGPPFDRFDQAPLTKRLVFSSWDIVPKVIAGYLSYEAERHIFPSENTPAARVSNDRRLLDFKINREGDVPRPASMAHLALLTPSPSLAAIGAEAMRAVGPGPLPSIATVLEHTRRLVSSEVVSLGVNADEARLTPDPRWYWAAPLLLDRRTAEGQAFWLAGTPVAEWTGGDPDGVETFAAHLREAADVVVGGIELGRRPPDLDETLALMALSGPANIAMRSIAKVLPELSTGQGMSAAARIGWGFRQLFNAPESIAIVDRADGEAYWRHVLRYSLAGNLQAVVDEWMHVLSEDAGAGRAASSQVIDTVIERMLQALGLRTSRVEVDPLPGDSVAWRTHFALRYGQARQDDATNSAHPEAVRRAFNSPFRPFVLATTSVGQEGLDFHPYCHAVVHWNLPTNPVDLEQREGRVHRYKGHAVRRNVAEQFGDDARRSVDGDPWATAFDAAKEARRENDDDLVPYWLQPGKAQIERHVPTLPYSKDSDRYARVRREVTLYRMVFGQPRQDDLIDYIRSTVGQADAERVAELSKINLAPPQRTVEAMTAV